MTTENCPPVSSVEEQPPRKKGKKLLLWSILAVILLIFIGVPFTLVMLIFAPWQEVPVAVPDVKDFSNQYKLMRKINKEFSKREKISQRAVLKFTPEDLNSLFKFLGNQKPGKAPLPIRYYKLNCSKEGVFSAEFPFNTRQTWLRGGTIYLRVSFTLSKKAGEDFQCKILSLKATRLNLGSSTAQRVLEKIVDENKSSREMKLLNAIIESCSFEDGKMVIVYNPQKILQTLR